MLIKHRFEFLFFIFFGKLLSIFGFSSIKHTSKIIAFIFFHILKIRRDVVIKNISMSFPQLTPIELKKAAYKNYRSIAITFIEIFLLRSSTKGEIKSHFDFIGLEKVKQKLKRGKGLILLTAHFGNWEFGAVAVGIYLNQKINVLVKSQRNIFVTNWLRSMREKFGNKEIPLGISVKEIFKALRNNEVVGVVGDQRGPKNGVKVKYFDKKTNTFSGTAAIAIKTKSPVLVMIVVRNSKGNYETKIEEIKIEKLTGSKEEQIFQFNQKYMSILEKYVKQYPEQWFWMHNIWKY